jgi:ABC-type phosphate/phosphonate transport system ATPase subunit
MPIDLDIVNKTVSLVAKRGSGKSVLLKYLVDSCKE